MSLTNKGLLGVAFSAFLVAAGATTANADTIEWGVPVAGNNSATQVGLPVVDNAIKYYIPLNGSNDSGYNTSGIYGVTDANGSASGTPRSGTFSDSGTGGTYLEMWLRFDDIANAPLATANLRFDFIDLDLSGVNDPYNFFETFQLFNSSGNLSTQFTAAQNTSNGVSTGKLDVNSGPQTEYIYWTLTRTTGNSGASNPISLEFYGDALAARITDPFFAKLKFTVPSGRPYGQNTAEYLTAKLTTTSKPVSVPEPSSTFLLGLGFAVVAGFRTRTQRTAI